jgi:hypothetical protein
MLTLWGKGGYGGSPNVEAGKTYQQIDAQVNEERPQAIIIKEEPKREEAGVCALLLGS